MKRKDECIFCKSRMCYERVVSFDKTYDEISCFNHIKELHKDSDIKALGIMKHFISSTGKIKRGIKYG